MKLSITTLAFLCLSTTSYAHNVEEKTTEGNLRTHSRQHEPEAKAQQEGRWGIDQDMLREGRIAGGNQANEANYPYFVHLGGCGASLIAPGVLLGAAHCGDYTSSNPDDYVIAAGQQAWITSSVNHTNWDGNQYDLQLMRLDKTTLMYSSNIELFLNDDSQWPTSGSFTVVGKGITAQGGSDSPYLKEINTPFMTSARCDQLWGAGHYAASMICTGGLENKGACAGDSGGPMVVKEGNDHILVGTVSHGDGCGKKDSPSIYVRVSAAYPWIKSVVCDQWKVSANFC